MPFYWREFLIVAHELRADQRESVQRTCLGRAYYYVYNFGLEWLNKCDGQHRLAVFIESFGIGV